MSEGEKGAVEIPITALSEEALEGVIRDFVLQEGTDYGHDEFPLEQKIEQVRRQLDKGKARIVYDPALESCTLVRSGDS